MALFRLQFRLGQGRAPGIGELDSLRPGDRPRVRDRLRSARAWSRSTSSSSSTCRSPSDPSPSLRYRRRAAASAPRGWAAARGRPPPRCRSRVRTTPPWTTTSTVPPRVGGADVVDGRQARRASERVVVLVPGWPVGRTRGSPASAPRSRRGCSPCHSPASRSRKRGSSRRPSVRPRRLSATISAVRRARTRSDDQTASTASTWWRRRRPAAHPNAESGGSACPCQSSVGVPRRLAVADEQQPGAGAVGSTDRSLRVDAQESLGQAPGGKPGAVGGRLAPAADARRRCPPGSGIWLTWLSSASILRSTVSVMSTNTSASDGVITYTSRTTHGS